MLKKGNFQNTLWITCKNEPGSPVFMRGSGGLGVELRRARGRALTRMFRSKHKCASYYKVRISDLAWPGRFFVTEKRWTSAVCVILPFGIYTVLAYAAAIKLLIMLAVIVASATSSIYTIRLMSRKIRKTAETDSHRICINRLYKCRPESLLWAAPGREK